MASFFGLCLWNRTFLSDLSRSTDANRSTFGCRFQSSSFLFHCSVPFFFCKLFIARIPTLLNADTLHRGAGFGKGQEKDSQCWKSKHVKDGRQGPAIDRAIDGAIARCDRSTSRDNRKWWRQPEVNNARPWLATPRKAPHVNDHDREHHPFATEVKEVQNDKGSKRLPLLLYPAGVQFHGCLLLWWQSTTKQLTAAGADAGRDETSARLELCISVHT